MRRSVRFAAIQLISVVLLRIPLFGWGNIGHMAVAYVAYQQLQPATKVRVDDLLKLNPDYQKWLSQVPADISDDQKPMILFMIAATWPDQIKSDAQYKDDGSGGGYRPDGPSASQNIGYEDKLRHKYWHFVDTPFTRDGSALPDIPTPNAETQVADFRAVIASDKPDQLKSYDLVWLLHLIGDVHQPLHCATRTSSKDPRGDNGGNNVALCAKPCKTELHGFWDDLPGTGADPTKAVNYAKKLKPADAVLASDKAAADWIKESFDAAQTYVYVDAIGQGDGPFTVTPAYKAKARAVAKDRIALGGARLANVLNAELK